MWKKIKDWIKKFGGWIVAGISALFLICDYAIHRRNDERTAVWGYRDRAADAERLSNRIERTTELESEFINDCEGRLEEVEQHLGAAEGAADRISESNLSAEQALAELRKRFAEDKDSE